MKISVKRYRCSYQDKVFERITYFNNGSQTVWWFRSEFNHQNSEESLIRVNETDQFFLEEEFQTSIKQLNDI